MDNMEELRAAVDAADSKSELFHQDFDRNLEELMEPVRSALLEWSMSCTQEEIIGQLLMNLIGSGDNHNTIPPALSVKHKVMLIRIADHMGPDWAQALYRAVVFITKVA